MLSLVKTEKKNIAALLVLVLEPSNINTKIALSCNYKIDFINSLIQVICKQQVAKIEPPIKQLSTALMNNGKHDCLFEHLTL